MHDAPPPDLDVDAVAATLLRHWSLDASDLRYLAVGGGDYHWLADGAGAPMFVTVADLDSKDWFGTTRDAQFGGLESALESATSLRDHHRLEFVVAPHRNLGGRLLGRVDALYAVCVHPFLRGESRPFGRHDDPDLRRSVLHLLARLHTAPAPASMPRHPCPTIGQRAALDRLLADPDAGWDNGPYGGAAHLLLRPHTDRLRARLAWFDDAARRATRDTDLVVTHGEPHGGNILRSDHAELLVDWDTVGLAPPERDLWFAVLDDEDADLYAKLSGREPDRSLVDLYRLRWRWDDLAHAIACLMAAHTTAAGAQRYLDALPTLLFDVL